MTDGKVAIDGNDGQTYGAINKSSFASRFQYSSAKHALNTPP